MSGTRLAASCRWWFAAAVIIVLQSPVLTLTGYAQEGGCVTTLTLLPDFSRTDSVEFDARVASETCVQDLPSRGLDTQRSGRRPGDAMWSVHGLVHDGHLTMNGDGSWTLGLGGLLLLQNDKLSVYLPFASVDYARIRPPPDNLSELVKASALALDGLGNPPTLAFEGTGAPLPIEIPFIPVRKRIALALEPLLDGMLDKQTDAFRVSGDVSFDIANAPAELMRHCENGPVGTNNYRGADLLFALDMPPQFNANLLSSIYRSKPMFLSITTTLTSCTLDDKNGDHAAATFNGRAFHTSVEPSLFPAAWAQVDTPVCNRQLGPDAPPTSSSDSPCAPGRRLTAAYEIDVGNIVLGPGDTLDVTVPGAEIRGVDPPPNRGSFIPGAPESLEYTGPRRFALHVVYSPTPRMMVEQLPAVLLAVARPIQDRLKSLVRPSGDPIGDSADCPTASTLSTLLVGAMAISVCIGLVSWLSHEHEYVLLGWLAGLVWAAAFLIFASALRGVFGLLVAAVILGVVSMGSQLRGLAIGLAGLTLVLVGAFVDCAGTGAFTVLMSLDIDSTPLTPVVLLGVGGGLCALLWRESGRAVYPQTTPILAVSLSLAAMVSFDVPHRSMPSVIVFGLGLGYLRLRLQRAGASMRRAEVVARLRRAGAQPVLGLAIVVLFAVAFENGLASSPATFGPELRQWSALAAGVLLVFSIVETFLILAVLTVVLYPVLPFKAGYLKGVVLGGFFFGVFVFGLGADDRLISVLPTLLIGRLVYYMGVPILLAVYLDLHNFFGAPSETAVADAARPSESQSVGAYFNLVRGQINTIGAIASIVAPGLYSYVTKAPLMITYFGLLKELLKATAT